VDLFFRSLARIPPVIAVLSPPFESAPLLGHAIAEAGTIKLGRFLGDKESGAIGADLCPPTLAKEDVCGLLKIGNRFKQEGPTAPVRE